MVNLRSTYYRWLKNHSNSDARVSKFSNNRYLTSPQKTVKLKQLQEKVFRERREMILQAKIEQLTSDSGIEVEPSFHGDLLSIMQDNRGKIEYQFPEGSFHQLFGEQQFKSAQKGPKQMRWHAILNR